MGGSGETSLMSYMVEQAELQPVCTLGRVVYTATWGWSWDTVNDKDLGMGRDGVAYISQNLVCFSLWVSEFPRLTLQCWSAKHLHPEKLC